MNQKTRRVPAEALIIGMNLRRLRKNARLSQVDVAGLLDVSFQQIQKYETGENRFPIEKLFVLKHHYGLPYGRFFDGVDVSGAHEGGGGLYRRIEALGDRDLKRKIEDVIRVLLD